MKKRKNADAPALAADVGEALRSMGWLVPSCEDDVAEAERRQAERPAALPEELREPRAAFDRAARPGTGGPRPVQFAGDYAVDATLARAAREGGRLTPEIEEAMRRDREAAEREQEDDESDA